MTQYRVGYLPGADDEYWQLPPRLRRDLRARLSYLRSGPFQSYPGLQVKEVEDAPGAWRIHLGPYRVFYRIDGPTIWIVMIWRDCPSAYSRSTLREVNRRLRR